MLKKNLLFGLLTVITATVAVATTAKYSLETQVYAGASYDFNQDGFMDSVFLVKENQEDMMYSMLFMTGVSHGEKQLTSVNKNLLMAVDGKFRSIGEPVVEFIKFKRADGSEYKPRSLRIGAEHWGIGRWKWSQVLTVAYRDGEFKLAGLDFNSVDTMTLDAQRCSINLLTGKKDTLDADGNYLMGIAMKDTSVVNKSVADVTEGKLMEIVEAECTVSKGDVE